MEDEDHYFGVTRYYDYYIALYDFMYRWHSTATELAVSRDGLHFQRVLNGHKLIVPGHQEEWDSSMPVIGHGFVTVKGKHYQYYTGSDKNYQEGSARAGLLVPWRRSTGLATWRQDGFTDLRVASGLERGWVTTKPIQAMNPGQYEIWVNANVPAPGNQFVVELLDAKNDRPLPGYGPADLLSGINNLEHVLTWKGSADLSRIHARSVRLRFTLKGNDVRFYSFGFRRKGMAHK
ncbi:MAG: hypothetical protein DMG07_07225 [Acidobacteria bacterium]|nr:MAG: hypothetical protein DMG07_07225 [Acidobacteriota bacterium]